jgi:hypothetical protein
VDIGVPEGLVSLRGLTGDLLIETKTRNENLRNTNYRLHAMRMVCKQVVPICNHPGCGITDPDMLAIDHIDNDGGEQRKKYRAGPQFHLAILRGDVLTDRLQILCANHNAKKAAQAMRNGSHRGRPSKVSEDSIRRTLGMTATAAAAMLGVSTATIYMNRKRYADLDSPPEVVVD